MNSLIRSALIIGSIVGIRKAASLMDDFDVNDVLGRVGLARRPSAIESILPSIGLVAAGALVGAGTALFLAPSSGAALRTRLTGRVDEVKNRLEDMSEKARSVVSYAQTTHS